MTDLAIKLGTPANLLNGLPTTPFSFFAPTTTPTELLDASVDPSPTPWGYPTITLHTDAESLVSALSGLNVAAAGGETGKFSIPAGPLTLGDKDSAAALSAVGTTLGVDLTKGYSFMLVRLSRSVGQAVHPVVGRFGDKSREDYLTANARAAYNALPDGAEVTDGDLVLDMKLTAGEATEYVSALYEYGTHFVSTVEAGDVIYQVFALETATFARLQAAFVNDANKEGEVTGIQALNYRYYTTPVSGPYGFVSELGHILSYSADPKLAATLKAGSWEDSKYANGNSVFSAYSAVNFAEPGGFLSQFSSVVPIGVTLSPLSDLVPDIFQARTLDRLFKGGMLLKFGTGVQVPFENLRDNLKEGSWSSLFPETDSGWLSTIATPSVDVYQEIVDLGSVQLINTDAVESFTVVSQVLTISGDQPIDIPGSDILLLTYILDTSDSAMAPTIRLSSEGMKGLTLSCGEMYGGLTIESSDGSARNVILDGFRFALGDPDPSTGRWKVNLVGDVLAPPGDSALAAVTTDLQFSLVTAETLVYSRGANAETVRKLMIGYLEWLAKLVPSDSQNADLVALATQALYLARAALNLKTAGAAVPYLKFEAYQGYVGSIVTVADALSDKILDYQSQIRARKQAELTAKTAQEINDNIKATGKLLTDYFGVLAQNQRDMAGYYQSIIDQKRQEFSASVTDVANLQASLSEQQKAVDQAVEDFKKAVVEWETEQILKFAFAVATDVFTLGVAIAIPSTEIAAVKSLGETAQKIQKVMTILAALSKMEEDIEKTVRTMIAAERALSQLDTNLQLPTSLEWQEFSINMKASLAAVSIELAGPRAKLIAAFDILALRGQALVQARAKQTQLLTDIYFNERQKNINDTQANRLAALTNALNLGDTSQPDASKIDLIGLTGQVQFQLKQVLAILAKTLVLQDAAVQYEYLGVPTPIQKFDLISLKQIMMQQQANVINALNLLNPPPQPVPNPIEFRIAKVPVAALSGGAVYSFTIQPSVKEFWKFAMVRVSKVVARIDGISGSDGGEYLAALTFVGNPFEDRNQNRNPLVFNTVERHFGPYNYEISTGKALFGNQTGGIGDAISRITPFGVWEISLPVNAINKGIAFSDHTVDIVLEFNITALLVAPPKRSALALAAVAAPAGLEAAAPSGAGTLADMLANMYQNQAVLKGWDVVFNILEGPVNAFLLKQHEEKYPGNDMEVNIGFCSPATPNPTQPGTYFSTVTKLGVTLEGPLLQFQQNNHDFVTVTQVIKSGYTQIGGLVVPKDFNPATQCNLDDPKINWGEKQTISLKDNPHIEGSVALATVQGLIQPSNPKSTTHSVVLDFKEGSFVARCLNISTDNAELNLQLSNWFTTHGLQYIINTLDYSNLTQLPALTPTKFLLNVLTTDSGVNILQQFITTNGIQQQNLTINVNEPIPQGFHCSLMVGTKIMFNDIFVKSFNQGSTNIVVESVDPGKNFLAWSAQVASGTVHGSAKFPDSGSTQYRINKSGNDVTWDISGLKFQRTEQLAINLDYQTTKKQSFEARQESCNQYGCYWSDWHGYSVNVNVVLTGDYPIVIKNSGDFAGKNQTIQLVSTPPNVNVGNTTIKPTGACECNDHDLQIAVLDELKKDVPGAIQAQIASIKFQPISIFSLENILFPAGNLITMDGAYVPGDLVVVGHFENIPPIPPPPEPCDGK